MTDKPATEKQMKTLLGRFEDIATQLNNIGNAVDKNTTAINKLAKKIQDTNLLLEESLK